MKNLKLTILFLTFISTLFVSCSSNDDGATNGKPTFSAKINGELFIADEIKDPSVIFHPELGQRVSFGAINEKYKIIFVIAQKEKGDCMQIGDYNVTNVREVNFSIFHRVEDTENFISPYFPEIVNGTNDYKMYCKIGSCSNNTISGTFSGSFYSVVDDANYAKNLEITEGKFSNIKYEELIQP